MNRWHYLDVSRSALFFLGIVLHAAVLCAERDSSYDNVFTVIHSFRMEAFFLIAGFFSAQSLARLSSGDFLKRRMIRLGVPFLFCAAVLDTIANCSSHRSWLDFSAEFTATYWATGEWLQHLWFLPTLMVYTILLLMLHSLCPSIDGWIAHNRFRLPWFLLGLSGGFFAAVHVIKILPDQKVLNAFLDIYETEKYAAFFFGGYVLFRRPDFLESITRRGWLLAAAILVLVTMRQISPTDSWKYVVELSHPLYVLSVCGLMFYLARRFFDRETRAIRAFSESSYTVYLVHWPVMIILYRFFAGFGENTLWLFLLLIACTAVLSFSVHLLVKRSSLFLFLLNGQWPPAIKSPRPQYSPSQV
jgi:peptidoglycan/LPS O-acetylase OafA/YrhL